MVFSEYTVATDETGAVFFTFVLVYTGFAYFLIAPLVSWGRYYATSVPESKNENSKPDMENEPDSAAPGEAEAARSEALSSTKPESSASSPNLEAIKNQKKNRTASDRSMSDYASSKTVKKQGSKSKFGVVLRELDRVAAAEYSDFASRISGRAGRSTVGSRTGTRLSSVSAATTSRLQSTDSGQRPSTSVWDVGGRRWKNRRPIGRVDVIQNAISHETVGSVAYFEKKSSFSKAPKMASSHRHSLRNMSDVASTVLDEQSSDGRTLYFSRSASINRSRFRLRRRGSFSSASELSHTSRMPSIVDDISPNDAADADDPGIGNIFQGVDAAGDKDGFGVRLGCLTSTFEGLLTLADPEAEIIRVWRLSVPLTLGAMSDPFFRLIMMAFISNFLGTESMIAYLLVNLFVRLTSEQLSVAIIDALSSFVEAVLHSADGEGSFLAGQYVQHAVLLQLLLGVPLLAVWGLLMGDVVEWLVRSSTIAEIADDYTRMVIFGYLAQALGRTVTVVFHICGYERFESVIDFSACALTMVAVACIVSLVEDASLVMVGYVQLLTGIAAAMAKIAYPALRGWMLPFWKGMAQNIALLHNPIGLFHLSYAAIPLLVGSILEYGEWELLTLFLRRLGPAEVSAWALLGSMWEVLEASTEGIGEAAAIRVAYLLAVGQPEQAKLLSYKVIYVSVIQSLLVTAFLLVFGKYLAVLLTSDPTLQHMLNNVIALVGLANATMSFAQVSWSLIGAQSRFRLATVVIFIARWLVTMPIALICIFGFNLDLNSVSGALVVGYSTASCALAYFVLRSDWGRLAALMAEINNMDEVGLDSLEDFDFSDGDDDESSDY